MAGTQMVIRNGGVDVAGFAIVTARHRRSLPFGGISHPTSENLYLTKVRSASSKISLQNAASHEVGDEPDDEDRHKVDAE